jgi:hypothetical protein
MKSAYGLPAVGFLAFGAIAASCVSGSTVDGSGGQTGSTSGQGGRSSGGLGGSNNGGLGGSFGGLGGSFGGGLGGSNGGGLGGSNGGGLGGSNGGGTAGSTGTTVFMPLCTPVGTAISDLEDGNFYFGTGCPKGAWHLSTAGGGTTTGAAATGDVPPVAITDRPGSTKAIHVSGSGQANVGVAPAPVTYAYVSLAASLNSPSATQRGALNGAGLTGVKFWGKIAGPIELQVPNVNTDPAGGKCTTGTSQCADNGKTILAPSAAWTQYMIPFSSLMGAGFGNSPGVPFLSGQIYSIEWHVTIPATGPVGPWDIWVDDLSFY